MEYLMKHSNLHDNKLKIEINVLRSKHSVSQPTNYDAQQFTLVINKYNYPNQ
jgi:hypothetical protein